MSYRTRLRVRGLATLVTVALVGSMLAGLAIAGPAGAQGEPFISAYVGGAQDGPCVGQVGACKVGLHQWDGDVTVTVYESSAKMTVLFEDTVTVDGFASIGGGGSDPGNVVVATDGTTTVEMELPMHSAEIDPFTNVVSGTSDPNGSISVAVITKDAFDAGAPENASCREVAIAPNGSWSVDFDVPVAVPGCPSDTFDFGPGDWVQVALNDVVEGGDVQTTAVVKDFEDDDGSIFELDITWLAGEGITKGCNPPDNTLFCPDDSVTRGQMAAFLVRALGYADQMADPFTDDDGSIFEADIEKLAAAGVTKGCNPPDNTLFCPDDPVTRGQMAAFLRRALG